MHNLLEMCLQGMTYLDNSYPGLESIREYKCVLKQY